MKLYIILLIYAHAPTFNIDPNLALAVAKTESSLNPKAIGPVGEVGVFQVRPKYSEYTDEELLDPEINVVEGLRILSEAKKRCPHKKDKQFVVCFNVGITGGYKIKNPDKFPYYKKVHGKYLTLKEKVAYAN